VTGADFLDYLTESAIIFGDRIGFDAGTKGAIFNWGQTGFNAGTKPTFSPFPMLLKSQVFLTIHPR
jgi:hypothetical protein